MKILFASVCISAVLFTACASGGFGKSSVTITDVQILRSGMYGGNFLERRNTVDGGKKIKWMEDIEYIDDSDRIPAVIGNKFGFTLVIKGEPDGKKFKVKVLRHHPPMKNPKKDKVTSLSEYKREFKINSPQGIGFGLDHDWELVEGEHLFEVFYGDQKLIEKSFTVFKP